MDQTTRFRRRPLSFFSVRHIIIIIFFSISTARTHNQVHAIINRYSYVRVRVSFSDFDSLSCLYIYTYTFVLASPRIPRSHTCIYQLLLCKYLCYFLLTYTFFLFYFSIKNTLATDFWADLYSRYIPQVRNSRGFETNNAHRRMKKLRKKFVLYLKLFSTTL